MSDVPAATGRASTPSDGTAPAATGWKGRLLRLERLVNSRAGSAKSRQWLLVFALVLFVTISVLSFRSLPDGVQFSWWPLPILILITTPAMVMANSAEFRLMGLINGHRIGWMPAARLTVVAGAANLLPLPGGIVIRTQALRKHGSSYKHALAANAAAGLAWVGAGCLAIAILFSFSGDTRLAALVLAAAAAAAIGVVLTMLRRVDRGSATRNLLLLLAVEGATVVISGVRIFLVFRLIGLTATAAQSVALTASQIIAAAVGIFPAGLGLRELLAGGIGSAVDLPVGQAISATASDRITGQLGLALLAGALLVLGRGQRSALPSEDEIDGVELTGPTAAS